jgi:hypothetical protein
LSKKKYFSFSPFPVLWSNLLICLLLRAVNCFQVKKKEKEKKKEEGKEKEKEKEKDEKSIYIIKNKFSS